MTTTTTTTRSSRPRRRVPKYLVISWHFLLWGFTKIAAPIPWLCWVIQLRHFFYCLMRSMRCLGHLPRIIFGYCQCWWHHHYS